MNYVDLLHAAPADLKKMFRDLEKIKKKLINNNWSIRFNTICMKENIMPNYSYFKLHDQAATTLESTIDFRWQLVERQIEEKKKLTQIQNSEVLKITNEIDNHPAEAHTKTQIMTALNFDLNNTEQTTKIRILKKLNKLYNGDILLKENSDSFSNLSDHILTDDEKEFLNLGLNYHLQTKYDKLTKETEIEALYQKLLSLKEKGIIEIDPRLPDQLTSEATKHRTSKYHSTIPNRLRLAAKNLKSNQNIVIKKADKSQSYVIMNKDDYINKIKTILSDTTKFKRIKKDPTNSLKQKANKLISTLNAAQQDIHLPPIKGDYSPGYIYGTVKTHKANNPLRPIISQVPIPTYQLSKSLNAIITPYIPNKFCLSSSSDFIDLLHSNDANGMIASLDVEALFTNVPICDTVDIIIKQVYNHPTIKAPKFPKAILKELLIMCTTEAPFVCPEGNLYIQTNGVSMGSCLGPTFSAFYMGNLEETIFNDNPNLKPKIYARYVDDIFLLIDNEQQLLNIRHQFQANSVLKFTYELNNNNKLPFLDIMVNNSDNSFKTTVYRKETNIGTCLDARSECVDRYKKSVITSYLNRAYKVCKNWNDFHNEINHVKQLLVNNNYCNKAIDHEINTFLKSKFDVQSNDQKSEKIPIYYLNQLQPTYKIEEKIIKNIVYNNTKCIKSNQKINLIIYYRNMRTSNLVMKNSTLPEQSKLDQTGVVYAFTCNDLHCKADEKSSTYIGMTQARLGRRLQQHLYNGSILQHFKVTHNYTPSKETLFENTQIIARASDRYKLSIKEALLISHNNPSINKQLENFVHMLRLHPHREADLQPSRNSMTAPINHLNSDENDHPSNSMMHIRSTHQVSPMIATRITHLLTNNRNASNNDEGSNTSSIRVLCPRITRVKIP